MRANCGPPRILFVCSSLQRGGAERQLSHLAVGLQERGWRVAVAVYALGGPFENHVRDADIPIVHLDHRGSATRLVRSFVRTVSRSRPDIVHGYLDTSNVLASLAAAWRPDMRVVWGVRASAVDFSDYEPSRRHSDTAARLLSRTADLIIGNSEAGRRDHIAAGYPSKPFTVIPNGIDIDRFRPSRQHRERMRASLGVTDSDRLIGVVGRFDPMKGHLDLWKAASRLLHDEPRFRFAVVGGGTEAAEAKLRGAAVRSGIANRLLWLGPRDDLATIYPAFDALCMPSRYGEGFPNVVAEAMACGVPPVVTDVGDAAKLVASIGAVARPRDPASLVHGFREIAARIEHDRDAVGAAARERIVAHYRVDQLIARTETHLAGLLDRDG